MRHGRAKQARRTLQFFERVAGIRPPYHLIVDGTFVIAVLKYKLPWQERLDKLLQHASFDLFVCASTMIELKALHTQAKDGDIFAEAIQWCQEYCKELEEEGMGSNQMDGGSSWKNSSLSPAAADILRITRNANTSEEANNNNNNGDKMSLRYFCATQDEELLDQLRQIAIPIIRLARGSVLLLEQPSKMATGTAKRQERKKLTHVMSEPEQQLVEMVKQQKRLEKKQTTTTTFTQRQRVKGKAKGPNPLSCKKRATDEPKTENKRKRIRKTKDNFNS